MKMSLPVLPVEIVAEIALNYSSGEVFLNFLLSCKEINYLISPYIKEIIFKLIENKRNALRPVIYKKMAKLYAMSSRWEYLSCFEGADPVMVSYRLIENDYTFIKVRGCEKYIGKTCDFKKHKGNSYRTYFSVLGYSSEVDNGCYKVCEFCRPASSWRDLSVKEIERFKDYYNNL
jgi:hypothetical protein